MSRRVLSIIALAFIAMLPLRASKGVPYPVTVRQPDGSCLQIRIFGDENYSYKTTADGYLIAQGGDGFYYYADYTTGVPVLSARRATNGGRGLGKTIPASALQAVSYRRERCASDIMSIAGPTRASSEMRMLVIPVEFHDKGFSISGAKSRIFNLFNQINYSYDGATGSVRDYLRDNFGPSFNFTFDVCDPVQLPHDASWYGGNLSGTTDLNIKQMVVQACSLADDSGIDFSRYDSDRDGAVDNVFIIFAGHNEAEGGGDDCIWPQSWNISDTQTSLDGVRISNFSCYSEFSGAEGEEFAGIGTICHEYCHILGLRDLYDSNGDSEGLASGTPGALSIMDLGNYSNSGKTPPYLTIVEREMLGLAEPQPISTKGHIDLTPVQHSGTAYRFRTSYADENFYLEYRDGEKWDSYIGGSGLVIYHVDKSANAAGSMTAAMRWSLNTVNCCADHECFRPIAANGRTSAHGYFFPGLNDVTTIHSAETFPLLDWSSRGVGFGLTSIARTANGLSAEVVEDNSWNLPVITDYSIHPEQTSALLDWEASKSLGGKWRLVWGDVTAVEADTVYTQSTSYTFEGLKPGSAYSCAITYVFEGISGKSCSMDFHTSEMLTDFPLIAGMQGPHHIGEEIRLRLHNMTEDVSSVIWYVNGVVNNEGTLTVQNEGSYSIKAVIHYPDGSEESIVKNFKVEGHVK